MQMVREIDRQAGTQTDDMGQTARNVDRQVDRWIDRQTDRQTR
jgi:hypothetical protein